MHLLMTTYRQHIMTTFGCGRDKSTVFTHFLGQFSKKYTQAYTYQYAKDQFHYNIVQEYQILSQMEFDGLLILSDSYSA